MKYLTAFIFVVLFFHPQSSGKIVLTNQTSRLALGGQQYEPTEKTSLTNITLNKAIGEPSRSSDDFPLRACLPSDGDACSVRTLSNSLMYLNRINSNAFIYLKNRVDNHDADINELFYQIEYPIENRLTALELSSRTNSNALLYLNRVNSNAINKNALNIRTNSNAFIYANRITSNAINASSWLSETVSILQDQMEYTVLPSVDSFSLQIRTNSNALIYLNRVNSNAINKSAINIRTNSNAFIYANRISSNAINYHESDLNTKIRTSSNALLYLNRVNSNALLYLNRVNSNAINKNALNIRTNSNAFIYANRITSNAINASSWLSETVSILQDQMEYTVLPSVDSFSLQIRTNSNALIYLNRVNSNAINKSAINIRTNSNAFIYANRISSNAINYHVSDLNTKIRTSSNALLYLNRVNSNAINTINNALSGLATESYVDSAVSGLASTMYVDNAVSGIATLESQMTNTVIPSLGSLSEQIAGISANSNALLYLNRITSNALLYLNRINSNAINQNAINIHSNSNALLYIGSITSNQISNLYDGIYGEDGVVEHVIANSNAIIHLSELNSDIENISDILRVSSNAIVSMYDTLTSPTGVLARLDMAELILADHATDLYSGSGLMAEALTKISANSNALLYANKINSNAIVTLEDRVFFGQTITDFDNGDSLANRLFYGTTLPTIADSLNQQVRTTSNALVYLNRVNSNAINTLDTRVFDGFIKTYFDAPTSLVGRVFGDGGLSSTSDSLKVNVNVLYNLSNETNARVGANSNTLLYLNRVNSNAIVKLNTTLENIENSALSVCTSYDETTDRWLSDELPVTLTCGVTINGNHHAWYFTRNHVNQMVHAGGPWNLSFENIVLKNFSDGYVGNPTYLSFRDSIIELSENQAVTMDWVINGNVIIDGHGNTLDFATNNKKIQLITNSSVTFKNIRLLNVRNNNSIVVQSLGPVEIEGTVILDNSSLTLGDANVAFPHGSLVIDNEVTIAGPATFTYSSQRPLLISQNAHLTLEKEITFNYAPASNNRDLIEMEDRSSVLTLNGCTLSTTTTGMRLTKGTLFVHGQSTFKNPGNNSGDEVISSSQGFELGNGTLGGNLLMVIAPGASANLVSGSLTYNNTD